MIPRDNIEKWLKYLRNELPTIAFKASTQSQKDHIVGTVYLRYSVLYLLQSHEIFIVNTTRLEVKFLSVQLQRIRWVRVFAMVQIL